jgi:glutaredoxin
MKDLKSPACGKLRLERRKQILELKVFTLPSCPTCPLAKTIASEVARRLNISYKEVNLATEEGLQEGRAYDIVSAPSVAIDDEVMFRGQLVSRERLEEEVKKRLEKWAERASKEET